MKNILLLLLITCSIWLSAETVVGGHISQNTVWTKANSPYLVTGVIYVDQNATLFIQPGVEVRINAAYLSDSTYNTSFSFAGGHDPVAKLFIVKGRIVAEGTKNDTIVFTRIQKDSTQYRWGVINIKKQAGLCIFKYCKFEYSGEIRYSLMDYTCGSIDASNRNLIIEKCFFKNHVSAAQNSGSDYSPENIVMINNEFYGEDENEIVNFNTGISYAGVGVVNANLSYTPFLFAGNKLNGRMDNSLSYTGSGVYGVTGYFVKNNFFNNNNGSALSIDPDDSMTTYIYDNYIKNAHYALTVKINNSQATAVIHKNTIVCDSGLFGGGGSVLEADIYNSGGFMDIAYNNLNNCLVDGSFNQDLAKIYNNTIINSHNGFMISGRSEVFNNIVINSFVAYTHPGFGMLKAFYNNLSYNTYNIFGFFDESALYPIQNCIFLKNDRWNKKDYTYTTIRNCVIDREWPEHLYIADGGGNIKVDSTAYDSLFTDYLNHDFSPKAGSRLIDAGFDTTGFYNSIAQNWFNRVADGNNDGIARIDIGPYEYGAKALGSLKGRILNSITGEGADYVLVKFNNNKTLFTFSDSLGCYEARLPAGNYNLQCNRLLYDDLEHNNININDEQVTTLNMQMDPDDTGITLSQDEKIVDMAGNYPNPFNSTTIITFNTRYATPVKLTIYNIKGEIAMNSLHNFTHSGKQRIGLNCINLSSGVYLYKLELATTGKQLLGKMNLIK